MNSLNRERLLRELPIGKIPRWSQFRSALCQTDRPTYQWWVGASALSMRSPGLNPSCHWDTWRTKWCARFFFSGVFFSFYVTVLIPPFTHTRRSTCDSPEQASYHRPLSRGARLLTETLTHLNGLPEETDWDLGRYTSIPDWGYFVISWVLPWKWRVWYEN